MDFTKSVSIIVSGVLTCPMIHTFMAVTPFIQPVINGILIGVDQCSRLYSGLYQRLNGGLLEIGGAFESPPDHIVVSFRKWAASLSPAYHGLWLPLIGYDDPYGPFLIQHLDCLCNLQWYKPHRTRPRPEGLSEVFFYMPSRSWVAILWTSPRLRSNSLEICLLDKFNTMK